MCIYECLRTVCIHVFMYIHSKVAKTCSTYNCISYDEKSATRTITHHNMKATYLAMDIILPCIFIPTFNSLSPTLSLFPTTLWIIYVRETWIEWIIAPAATHYIHTYIHTHIYAYVHTMYATTHDITKYLGVHLWNEGRE